MSILKQLNSRKKIQDQELFDAVSQNNILKVKILINQGANVNAYHNDKDGILEHCTCLYRSIKNGYLEISRILIKAGADVNAPVYIFKNKHISSPIYPLEGAVNNLNTAVAATKLLLDNGASVSSIENRNPLFKTCYWYHFYDPKHERVLFECCRSLIEAGADINDFHLNDYNVPLFFTAINGYKNIIRLFLEHGAILDLASSFMLDRYETVEVFLQNNPTTPTNNIGALLCKSLERNNIELCTKIINYGINLNITIPVSSLNSSKICPLESANTYDSVKLLLNAGADPNYILDGDKHSHILCSLIHISSVEILRLLLDYKANPNQQYENYNTTVLQSALSTDLPYQKAKLLLDAGADIHTRNSEGLSVIHYIFYHKFSPERSESIFSSLSEIVRTLDLLLEYNANPNLKDNKGNTPLHLAASNNYSKILFKQLIKAGCDVYTQNYFGETALDLAIRSINIEYRKEQNKSTIQFLQSLNVKYNILTALLYKDTCDFLKELDNIEDIEIKDSNYNTLLHYAIENKSFAIVRKLICKGVQINCVTANMQTALDLANIQKNNQLIEYLKIYGAKEANEIFKCRAFYYYLPNHSGTVVINYNLESENKNIVEVDPTNLLSYMPGTSLNKAQKHILLEVFDYISSIFRIKFNVTKDVSETNLFIGNIDKYKNNRYDIKRYISGTNIIRSSLVFDLRLDIDHNSTDHLFSIFLQSITQILGLIENESEEPSVLLPITNFTQRISYSKFDLCFLSSRYQFNKEFLLKPISLSKSSNHSLTTSIKSAIKQHDFKRLTSLVNSIDNIDFKDSNGNYLINLAAIIGFVEGTEFLYRKGAELDLASALILGRFDKATEINNQQDALENYKQLDQLMLTATLRENIPLLKALIKYGIQIDDDIFLLSIEIANIDIIEILIAAGANTAAVNQKNEGILAIATKINCSDQIIKLLQESSNSNKSNISSNIIDFKTGRLLKYEQSIACD